MVIKNRTAAQRGHTFRHCLEFYRDKNKKWRFKFRHRNTNIIVWSEDYANITMARKSAFSLMQSIKEDDCIIVTTK